MVSPKENEQKKALLAWAASHPYAVYLDGCGTGIDRYGDFEYLIATAGEQAPTFRTWEALKAAVEANSAWCFGVLTYDLKNSLEPQLQTRQPAAIPFPEILFFQAETVVAKRKSVEQLEVLTGELEQDWEEMQLPPAKVSLRSPFTSNFTRPEYIQTIQRLRKHIQDGDCYEINLAQNYSAEATVDHPEALWRRLTEVSPTPFATYARFRETHVMCASPERFLQSKDGTLTTQPIKGTSRRSRDKTEDQQLAQTLRESEKEQAENVMIVDLSRHDLHRCSTVGGVTVPHLFEVQSFAKVHHLVSTIQATARPDLGPVEAIEKTFPPGSMTGAPKFRTCQLIDHYEPTARGIYAGSIGYIDPEGRFDFNVVIRTLIYDASLQKLSYHVGGAITWDSDPEAEYEETLVKATAIREVLEGG